MSVSQSDRPVEAELLASVIITSYNRCPALLKTLDALGRQTVDPGKYEILVVDNGSTDETYELASRLVLPCSLTVLQCLQNQGIAGGRNLALGHAHGRYLILVSDDLIVPEDFIAMHLETHDRFPGCWIVGGFEQLDSLTDTPFGRYLDWLERSFTERRKANAVGSGLWEMGAPTARNLSLPRRDYERIGPFDEQFANACEDQDWAHRMQPFGVRFLYNESITCIHNDQAGDLKRYCRAQLRGAHDTALFCAKYPEIHGGAAIGRVNGHVSSKDGVLLMVKKTIKAILSRESMTRMCERAIEVCERIGLSDRMLWRMYRMLIGVYIFRGWRAGLATLKRRSAGSDAQRHGYHSNI